MLQRLRFGMWFCYHVVFVNFVRLHAACFSADLNGNNHDVMLAVESIPPTSNSMVNASTTAKNNTFPRSQRSLKYLPEQDDATHFRRRRAVICRISRSISRDQAHSSSLSKLASLAPSVEHIEEEGTIVVLIPALSHLLQRVKL